MVAAGQARQYADRDAVNVAATALLHSRYGNKSPRVKVVVMQDGSTAWQVSETGEILRDGDTTSADPSSPELSISLGRINLASSSSSSSSMSLSDAQTSMEISDMEDDDEEDRTPPQQVSGLSVDDSDEDNITPLVSDEAMNGHDSEEDLMDSMKHSKDKKKRSAKTTAAVPKVTQPVARAGRRTTKKSLVFVEDPAVIVSPVPRKSALEAQKKMKPDKAQTKKQRFDAAALPLGAVSEVAPLVKTSSRMQIGVK